MEDRAGHEALLRRPDPQTLVQTFRLRHTVSFQDSKQNPTPAVSSLEPQPRTAQEDRRLRGHRKRNGRAGVVVDHETGRKRLQDTHTDSQRHSCDIIEWGQLYHLVAGQSGEPGIRPSWTKWLDQHLHLKSTTYEILSSLIIVLLVLIIAYYY